MKTASNFMNPFRLFAAVLLLGLFAGFFGTRSAESIIRVSDVFQSFPIFILAMMLTWWVGRQWIGPWGALAAAAPNVCSGRPREEARDPAAVSARCAEAGHLALDHDHPQ